ncbi:nickel pincer cofactor biosynthesis protein LarC [Edaphobacter aggregans]|uniref:nickel pincer cofactor biosynthesis protein LarC n=1 Tax=Edaphobacter aggregans TaxID=570835 RepID=UPI000550F6DB|nr:nickel pincer cofactor biosynthesis protein LarC [Edaphobacter aggregans]
MRIAYLDCFAGISGDMFLGALIEAGVPPQVLHDAASALNLGASLSIEKVDRSGISSTKVHVLENGRLAEAVQPHKHDDRVQQQRVREHHHHPGTQHQHKIGHSHAHDEPHAHDHPDTHGRSLSVIRSLIQSASLPDAAKHTAIHAFELLGASEAKIHNVPIEKIHFHEVGAVDAIVDIVAVSAGIHALAIDAWYSSPINVGGGMVDCAHGRFPVPAPATADLLRGMPTYSAHVQQELVTPTGAALIRAISPTFGPQPAMRVQQIGYGAGSRNPQDFPNVLRLSIGDAAGGNHASVAVLETAIDDLSPQILAHVSERALALGALDVMSTAVQMKKGRLGTHITVLADDANVPALEDLLLRETSTLGVRIHHERRSCLDRSHTTVATPYGDIRIKVGSRNNETYNAAPEFEDCRAAAAQHNVPVKLVQQAAIAAYHSSKAAAQ